MAVPPSETESVENRTFLSQFYSHYLGNRIHALYPYFSTNFLSTFVLRFRSTQRRECLPLPLPSSSLDAPLFMTKRSRVHDVLEDILERVLINLHSVQKNLQFWQSRAKRSDSEKARFMIFERGPRAFIDETVKLLRGLTAQGSSTQNLSQSASDYIDERVGFLSSLRYSLATFLAQVYMEVDKIGEDLVEDPETKLPSLLVTISVLFSTLEASIGHLHAMRQSDSSVDGSYSTPLLFEKVPEINQEGSQWTDCEIRDAINSVYQNLNKLDSYISFLVIKHRKPRKITQYWIRYTCGAVGLSVCSIWLLRHSRLVGSSDLDNWVQEARNSTYSFFRNHVEEPIFSIRDELFDTFKKRHQGIMDVEEVQLTSNSLHRMLLAFSEQTKGQKFPVNASDQEMMEIVMDRYEKELMHPIQNLLNGELVRAILIQVQKLKLDTETAMLELNQILRANEINFAVLTALPAFFLSLLLMMLVRGWFKQDTKAEGRGRVARIQRRLLVIEVKKRIMQYQNYVDQGREMQNICLDWHSIAWIACITLSSGMQKLPESGNACARI
ncbi:protein DGS1, mitochondrial isoform X2 [Glycine max]|uniref:protein DGS1, mitochondrial isoform X2 n=1 Tax=Glycine max TaxID=3847 RepID=UPI0003DECC27|nr:protein DGS1, mitochondrial isoform X2 [Glycine max]|eukprot:XP_006575615.1 protein DGS1, mitochondrial isoform X2 [Glycine max]